MVQRTRAVRCIALGLLFGMTLLVAAQQHSFRQFTPKDGLAQSQVRAMAQDANGYLWFGTLGGASRFDGQAFHNIALQDGLPDAHVSAMALSPDGRFWMGVGNSLVQVVGRSLHVTLLPGRGSRILGLAGDEEGRLFIGTDGDGVFLLDSIGLRQLEGYPVDSAGNVRSFLRLKNGNLLIGLRNGLLHYDHVSFRAIPLGDGEPEIVSALGEGADGSWWVGTLGSGLFHIAPNGEQKEYDEETGLIQNNVRCLLVDDRDRVWVGTKLGVNLISGGRTRVFTIHQGMPNDNIQCAYQDSEGSIWFGTDGAGAIRYLGERFVTYTTKDGLCSDLVMSITADAQGDLWLGTYDNGICRSDAMAMITTLDGLPNNTIWCGLLDRDGSLWFGTSDGLAHVKDGVVLPLADSLALPGQRVFALHQDSTGAVWCGTREGLTVIGPGTLFRNYPASDDGPGRSVRAIVSGDRGRLWLATDNGLVAFQNEGFTSYTEADGLCNNTVLGLAMDRSERLWVGTANGLACMDQGRLRNIRFGADFGSNYINMLVLDPAGRLWTGTNNGLFLFHTDSLLADSNAYEHITMAEGLRSLEFNLNASHQDGFGRTFFGTSAGLVMHDARRDVGRGRSMVPSVLITGVRSFLQTTEWKGQCDSLDLSGLPIGLHLGYRRQYLTFDYVAISLSRSERVRYRYRLVGYDPDWLPATDARFASYSNLPHGGYVFEVSATTDGENWSAPSAFQFTIDPPYWARWWFFALCLLALSAILFGVQRYRAIRRERRDRTRQLMLRSRMLQLEQQALNANMNRHFVFNALNSIQFHINRQDKATASRYLTSFAKLIRKNLDASENDTTSLTEELERLELYLNLEHMRFKDKFRYTITLDPDVDASHVRLPAMMLQPYVENSIWHGILPMGHQGHVHITVRPTATEGRIEVRIEDDGIGVEQSLQAKQGVQVDHISRGIEITKGRADVLRKLELTDIRIQGPEQWVEPGTNRVLGTRVTIELPVDIPVKKSA